MNNLTKRDKIEWKKVFPNTNPLALDLLDKMLVYNPKKRYFYFIYIKKIDKINKKII